jgi:hypothetical protein
MITFFTGLLIGLVIGFAVGVALMAKIAYEQDKNV